MTLSTIVLVLLFAVNIAILNVNCEDFNKNLVGVTFNPFVRNISCMSGYETKDVKTMLEVILTRFSRIMTLGVDANNDPYERKTTYLVNSEITAKIAEVAAKINREKNTKALTVLIGIFNRKIQEKFESEFRVAVEAAEIANTIYNGTVEGIQFTESFSDYHETNKTLLLLKNLRKMTSSLGIKIGTHQYCSYFLKEWQTAEEDDNYPLMQAVLQEIVKESDFIICMAVPTFTNLEIGVKTSFSVERPLLLHERWEIKKINPKIEVMVHTLLPVNKFTPWNTSEDLKEYWEEVNEFATQENFSSWLSYAFDPTFTFTPFPYSGWWKLSSDDVISNASGYIEKITGKPVEIITESMRLANEASKRKYYSRLKTGIMAGALGLLLVLLGFQIFIHRYRRSMHTILTAKDITDFRMVVPSSANSEENSVNVSAFKQPYDKSYEIRQEHLEILWDEVLGGGEFGFVCKATLIRGNEQKVVAVKMARPGRLTFGLKGILSEIKILIYLGNHRNIVTICGAYTAELEQGIAYLVTELCPLGNLKDHLRKFSQSVTSRILSRHSALEEETSFDDATQRNAISLAELTQWSHEVACGMEYLETKNVIHADLATRNVLLSSDRIAKIADFGLSKRLSEYSNCKKKKGRQEPRPWRWMALESLTRLEFSVKSDVWSYGVTLWEIFSLGDLPFPERFWDGDFIKALEAGLRLSQPANATDDMYQLMMSCWTLSPMHRELRAKTQVMLASEEEKNEVQDIYSLE